MGKRCRRIQKKHKQAQAKTYLQMLKCQLKQPCDTFFIPIKLANMFRNIPS